MADIIGKAGIASFLAVGTNTVSLKLTPGATVGSWGIIKNRKWDIGSGAMAYYSRATVASGAVTAENLSFSPTLPNDSELDAFMEYWRECPLYIQRLNVRGSTKADLPMAIKVITPDVFTGNLQTQMVDVQANVISTQYQDAIVTLSTSLLLGRSSYIEIIGNNTANGWLALDMTVTHHASLELGMQNFLMTNTQAA